MDRTIFYLVNQLFGETKINEVNTVSLEDHRGRKFVISYSKNYKGYYKLSLSVHGLLFDVNIFESVDPDKVIILLAELLSNKNETKIDNKGE